MYRPSHKRIHHLHHPLCLLSCRNWRLLLVNVRSSIRILPLHVPHHSLPTSSPPLLGSKTSTYRVFRRRNIVQLRGWSCYGCRRNDLRTAAIVLFDNWVLGVLGIYIWRAVIASRFDTKCWALVVLFHRDVRLI